MSVNEIPTNFVLVKIDVNGVEKEVKIEKGCLFENNDIKYKVGTDGKLNIFDVNTNIWQNAEKINFSKAEMEQFQKYAALHDEGEGMILSKSDVVMGYTIETNNELAQTDKPKTQLSISLEDVNELKRQSEMLKRKYANSNSGAIGTIVFNPKFYNDNGDTNVGFNSQRDINEIIQLLGQNTKISPETLNKLIMHIRSNEVAFFHGGTPMEISSITEDDAKLIIEYANKIPVNPTRQDLEQLDLEFRTAYLNAHSKRYSIDEIENPNEILEYTRVSFVKNEKIKQDNDTTVTLGAQKWSNYGAWEANLERRQNIKKSENKFLGFQTVKDLGVNPYLSNGTLIPSSYRALAESASDVADDLSTAGYCFTGVKHALLTAGIITDYGEMRDKDGKNISKPREAAEFFRARPEKFTEVKYVLDGADQVREINVSDIYNLPAGYIVLWVPEEGAEFASEAGHASITNGNKQSYGDHTDSQRWEYFRKGEHGTFQVFKLNEQNWKFNPKTNKNEYIGP